WKYFARKFLAQRSAPELRKHALLSQFQARMGKRRTTNRLSKILPSRGTLDSCVGTDAFVRPSRAKLGGHSEVSIIPSQAPRPESSSRIPQPRQYTPLSPGSDE